MDRGPCVQCSSGSPVGHIDALHGRSTFVLLVAASLADGVLDHYETGTNGRMRHEPNASLHLHAQRIEDRTKRKRRRRKDGPDVRGRRCAEYRIDMHHSRHLQIVFGEGTNATMWLALALLSAPSSTLYLSISISSVLSFAPVSRPRCSPTFCVTASTVARVCRVEMSCEPKLPATFGNLTPLLRNWLLAW